METYQDRLNRERLEGMRRVNTTAPPDHRWVDGQWGPACEEGRCHHGDENVPMLLEELLSDSDEA